MGWIEPRQTRAAPTRLLFVDDDPSVTALVPPLLESADADVSVTSVTDAAAAREHLRTTDVDCVVSDYQMPGETGIDLLEHVRADYPNLPFILLTAKGDEDTASEAIAAGVDDYVTKDLLDRPELFANRIENPVDRKRNVRARLESEERYRTIANTVADSICIFQGGTLVYANERFCTHTGGDRSDLRETDATAFVHEDDRALCADVIEGRLVDDADVGHSSTSGLYSPNTSESGLRPPGRWLPESARRS